MYTVSQSVDPDHFRVTAGTYVPSTLVVKVFFFFFYFSPEEGRNKSKYRQRRVFEIEKKSLRVTGFTNLQLYETYQYINKCLNSYFIWLYERQNCLESDLYGSNQVESPICRARSQICTQYMLGVRFVRACHLALVREVLAFFWIFAMISFSYKWRVLKPHTYIHNIV